jgi:hypothetical protein
MEPPVFIPLVVVLCHITRLGVKFAEIFCQFFPFFYWGIIGMKKPSPFADLPIPAALAAYLLWVGCLWIRSFTILPNTPKYAQ